VTGSATVEQPRVQAPFLYQQQETGHSVRAPNANSLPLVLRVSTIIQQTMAELNGVLSEEKNYVNYKNILKSNEAKLSVGFIGSSKSYI
jgi:arginine decarboxylase-like protein